MNVVNKIEFLNNQIFYYRSMIDKFVHLSMNTITEKMKKIFEDA